MKKCLIVVDMQRDFVTGVLGSKEAQEIVPKIKEYAENFEGEILYTLDTHDSNYSETQEGKKLPVEHCIKGTEGFQLVPELGFLKLKGCAIHKHTFGSLYLPQFISGSDAEIYLCGVCTGICVISNAMILKASFPEAKITVLKDLCACVTPESHNNAIEAMKMCQIDIE